MHWSVSKDDPPMVGKGYTTLLDGEPVERVTEMDTDDGWLVKHCQGEKEGHPEGVHLDPDRPDDVCLVRREGEVNLLSPGGQRLGW